jgi:hypothetical protein
MGAPTVAYKVSYTSPPRYSGSRANGLSAQVRYKVDWANAFTFVNDVLGAIDGSPWAFPASPNLKATEATINPIGVKSGGSGDGTTGSAPGEYFEKAHIDVTFNSQSQQVGGVMDVEGSETIPALQFDQSDPIEMASFNIQYSPQMIRIPGGSLKWSGFANDGSLQVVPTDVKSPTLSGGEYIRKPAFNLNITLHNCLSIKSENFVDKIGKINNSVIFGSCTEETVLFDGVSSTQRSLSNGLAIIDVTLNYKWQKIGWNVAMGSDGEIYRYEKKNGDDVYETADIRPTVIIPPSQRWSPTSF